MTVLHLNGGPHTRVSSTDFKVRNTFYSILNSWWKTSSMVRLVTYSSIVTSVNCSPESRLYSMSFPVFIVNAFTQIVRPPWLSFRICACCYCWCLFSEERRQTRRQAHVPCIPMAAVSRVALRFRTKQCSPLLATSMTSATVVWDVAFNININEKDWQ